MFLYFYLTNKILLLLLIVLSHFFTFSSCSKYSFRLASIVFASASNWAMLSSMSARGVTYKVLLCRILYNLYVKFCPFLMSSVCYRSPNPMRLALSTAYVASMCLCLYNSWSSDVFDDCHLQCLLVVSILCWLGIISLGITLQSSINCRSFLLIIM